MVADSLADGADPDLPIVMLGLDTAHIVGIDTGTAWITARLVAPELTETVADSVSVTVVPRLAFTTQPRDSISTGEILSVTVSVLDGRGDIVAEPRRVALSLGILNDADSLIRVVDRANPDATFFFGDSIVETVDGVATYDAVKIFTPGSGYTLVASSGRLTRAASVPFRVGQLILRIRDGNDQSDTVDTQLPVSPSVELVNELGRPVRARDVKFRVTAGDGRLSDTLAVTNDSGVASVDWRLGTEADSANNNVLEAFVDNAPDVQSVFFRATALPDQPDALELATQPSTAAICNVPFDRQPVVQILDRFNNRSRDELIPVVAEIVNGDGVLGGADTVLTGADGRAVFGDLSLDGSVGNQRLQFTSPNLDPTQSVTVDLRAGPPAQLTITSQPPDTVESDEQFANPPRVRVDDACGNPLRDLVVTATITPGMGTLDGDSTVSTNSAGIATFSGLSIVPTATDPGDYSFVFTFSISAPGVPAVVSNPVVVTIPAPAPFTDPSTTTRSTEATLAPAAERRKP